MAQGCERLDGALGAFGRPLTASLFPCKTGSKMNHRNAEGIASVGTEKNRTVKGQMCQLGPHETSGRGFTEWPSVCVLFPSLTLCMRTGGEAGALGKAVTVVLRGEYSKGRGDRATVTVGWGTEAGQDQKHVQEGGEVQHDRQGPRSADSN